MKTQLKDLSGRRQTPGVKILMLVAIVFLGLLLAFDESSRDDKKHADKAIVE